MGIHYIPAPETELDRERSKAMQEILRLSALEREDRATASQSKTQLPTPPDSRR